MLVEITGRTYWLDQVEKALKAIDLIRAEKNAEYENTWQKNHPPRKATWFTKAYIPSEKPPENWPFYPTTYADSVLDILRQMKIALTSENTGTITFSGEELSILNVWLCK